MIRSKLNPLHAKSFKENINIYLHFMSYLQNDMTQVVEKQLGVLICKIFFVKKYGQKVDK